MQGFVNLNKPFGMTSHDCVAKVRRSLKLKRVGHGGTLDPAATGVLPIAIGRATRLLQFLRQDKAYKATVRLGITTTTDDLEGEAIATQPVPDLELETVKTALQAFQGTIQQVPPNYSAIQVQGKRLYDLARTGAAIAVEARPVEIFRIEVLDWRPGDFPEIDLAIACGPGTYIRAIARDLGIALQTGGTLAALTRTQSCGLDLADSLTFEALEAQLQAETFQPISAEAMLTHLPVITLSAELAHRWCYGQRIRYEAAGIATMQLQSGEAMIAQIYHADGRLLGITQQVDTEDGTILAPQIVLEPN